MPDRQGRPAPGYRYPKGRLNQLASMYFGAGAGVPIANSNGSESSAVIEGANTGTGEGNGVTRPLTSMPTVEQPTAWSGLKNGLKNVATFGASAGAQELQNKLAQAKYSNQLQQLIKAGDYQQAMDLAKFKATADEHMAGITQANDLEKSDYTTDNAIRKAQEEEGLKRGFTGFDQYSNSSIPALSGQNASNDLLKSRVVGATQGSPDGMTALAKAWFAEQAKQGLLNNDVAANTGKTIADTSMVPWANVGPGGIQVNRATGQAIINQAPELEKPAVPGKVVGMNAFDNTDLVVNPNNPSNKTTTTTSAPATIRPLTSVSPFEFNVNTPYSPLKQPNLPIDPTSQLQPPNPVGQAPNTSPDMLKMLLRKLIMDSQLRSVK